MRIKRPICAAAGLYFPLLAMTIDKSCLAFVIRPLVPADHATILGKDPRQLSYGKFANSGGTVSATKTSLGDALVNVSLPAVVSTLNTLRNELVALSLIQKGLFLVAIFLGFGIGGVTPFWKRFTDAAVIPEAYFDRNRKLRGRAVRVIDGDTIRFLHRPTFWSPRQLQTKERASKLALPIRFCTVDTPETAKFGKKGQPFAKEAKDAVHAMLDNRPVYIRLLKRDQYSRIVAQVYTKQWRFFKKFADEELLRMGLAEVYTGAGAVYGPKGKEAYLDMERTAKSKQIGMWAQGSKRESAADYKKRTK